MASKNSYTRTIWVIEWCCTLNRTVVCAVSFLRKFRWWLCRPEIGHHVRCKYLSSSVRFVWRYGKLHISIRCDTQHRHTYTPAPTSSWTIEHSKELRCMAVGPNGDQMAAIRIYKTKNHSVNSDQIQPTLAVPLVNSHFINRRENEKQCHLQSANILLEIHFDWDFSICIFRLWAQEHGQRRMHKWVVLQEYADYHHYYYY